MKDNPFVFHMDELIILDRMTLEQAGFWIKETYKYRKTGKRPKLDFGMDMALTPIFNRFDRDEEKYQGKVETNKKNGAKGGKKSKPKKNKPKQANGSNGKPNQANGSEEQANGSGGEPKEANASEKQANGSNGKPKEANQANNKSNNTNTNTNSTINSNGTPQQQQQKERESKEISNDGSLSDFSILKKETTKHPGDVEAGTSELDSKGEDMADYMAREQADSSTPQENCAKEGTRSGGTVTAFQAMQEREIQKALKFYDDELAMATAANDPLAKKYENLIPFFKGNNRSEKRADHILLIKEQLSFDQFKEIRNRANNIGETISKLLNSLVSRPHYTKGANSLSSLLHGWLDNSKNNH